MAPPATTPAYVGYTVTVRQTSPAPAVMLVDAVALTASTTSYEFTLGTLRLSFTFLLSAPEPTTLNSGVIEPCWSPPSHFRHLSVSQRRDSARARHGRMRLVSLLTCIHVPLMHRRARR